jgi:dCMP deaminase
MAKRPTWDEYFLSFARLASTRSHDSQTQVGCVIISEKKILAVGYNGFCSGVKEDELPTTRPDKYPYMVHAEENAVSNMLIKTSTPKTAYITHFPCYRCAKLLWQNNIRSWKIPLNKKVESSSQEDSIVYDHLVRNGLKISWL